MSRRKRITTTLAVAATLAAGLTLGATSARAEHDSRSRSGPSFGQNDRRDYRDRDNRSGVSFGINFGNIARPAPPHCAPPPPVCTEKRWVPGYYENYTDRVLVRPAQYEQRWVPPTYQTRYDHCGRPINVCIVPGHYEQVLIAPPCYEDRVCQRYVPGHWETVAVSHPASVRTGIRIGGHFEF